MSSSYSISTSQSTELEHRITNKDGGLQTNSKNETKMKLVAMRNIQIDQIDAHFSRHNVPEQMTSVIVRCSAPTNKHEHGISLQNKQKHILEQHRWIRTFCRVDCNALNSSRSMSPKITQRESAHKKINKVAHCGICSSFSFTKLSPKSKW